MESLSPSLVFCVVAGVALFTGLGDYLSKKFSLNPNWHLAFYAASAYLVGVLFWFRMIYHFQSLARAGELWILTSGVLLLVISQCIFHEPLSPRQWAGVALGLIAIVLLL
jgi:drug/metabolite transporter (DMT)-like permease